MMRERWWMRDEWGMRDERWGMRCCAFLPRYHYFFRQHCSSSVLSVCFVCMLYNFLVKACVVDGCYVQCGDDSCVLESARLPNQGPATCWLETRLRCWSTSFVFNLCSYSRMSRRSEFNIATSRVVIFCCVGSFGQLLAPCFHQHHVVVKCSASKSP